MLGTMRPEQIAARDIWIARDKIVADGTPESFIAGIIAKAFAAERARHAKTVEFLCRIANAHRYTLQPSEKVSALLEEYNQWSLSCSKP